MRADVGTSHNPHPDALSPGGRHLQRQAVERALRRPDRMGGDLRVARRRRQIIVPEQDLDDPNVGSVLQKMRAKLWRSVCSVTRLVRPAAFTAERQAACNTVGSIG